MSARITVVAVNYRAHHPFVFTNSAPITDFHAYVTAQTWMNRVVSERSADNLFCRLVDFEIPDRPISKPISEH